jgi:hypothetical protein
MSIHVITKVLPGKKIEVSSPELREGEPVSVTIDSPPKHQEQPASIETLELVRSFPKSTRTAEEWAAFDRQFRAERDSWD